MTTTVSSFTKIFTAPRATWAVAALVMLTPVHAADAQQRFSNTVAVFAALDKVTATIREMKVPLDQPAKFGALTITPRVCYSRPATEQPKTTSFVEVVETQLEGTETQLFTGWMFAESPGLNAVEHPVYDVWLTGCEKPNNATAQTMDGAEPGDGEAGRSAVPRRRVRR